MHMMCCYVSQRVFRNFKVFSKPRKADEGINHTINEGQRWILINSNQITDNDKDYRSICILHLEIIPTFFTHSSKLHLLQYNRLQLDVNYTYTLCQAYLEPVSSHFLLFFLCFSTCWPSYSLDGRGQSAYTLDHHLLIRSDWDSHLCLPALQRNARTAIHKAGKNRSSLFV